MAAVRKINVPGLARIPTFCHATVAGHHVFVSGTLGVKDDVLELVEGGITAQTCQTLHNMERILAACRCSWRDVVKVNVYLTDMSLFGQMNEAYLSVVGENPPARVTIGCTELALGALVEMDCIAALPDQAWDPWE